MAWVVFLRGVNLGAKRFSPAALAKGLAHLEFRSVGAAGTFVARKGSAREVRSAVEGALPFETEVMVCRAQEVLALVRGKPFGRLPAGAKPFVSVLAKAPRATPALPIERPEGEGWQVRVVEVRGPFALSVRRNTAGRFYPNEVVERALGVRATTRGWPTFERLARAFEEP